MLITSIPKKTDDSSQNEHKKLGGEQCTQQWEAIQHFTNRPSNSSKQRVKADEKP